MFYLEKSGSSVSSSAGVFTSVAPGTYTVRVVITVFKKCFYMSSYYKIVVGVNRIDCREFH